MVLDVAPVAVAQLLIRRPPAEVFRAFVDPAITSKFWFSSASDSLAVGETVTWTWSWYGATAEVIVDEIEPDRRILIRWPTPVEWLFTPKGPRATLVQVTASKFEGSPNEQVAQAIDAMGGFTLVLAGCKAYLEHEIELGLVPDQNPDHHVALG